MNWAWRDEEKMQRTMAGRLASIKLRTWTEEVL